MEMSIHSHANKTHFYQKGCALGLILKVRIFGSRKWPTICRSQITDLLATDKSRKFAQPRQRIVNCFYPTDPKGRAKMAGILNKVYYTTK